MQGGRKRWGDYGSVFGFDYEVFFAHTAYGAYPFGGKIFKSCSGGDTSFGVADCGIIDPVANFTTILFHSRIGL